MFTKMFVNCYHMTIYLMIVRCSAVIYVIVIVIIIIIIIIIITIIDIIIALM